MQNLNWAIALVVLALVSVGAVAEDAVRSIEPVTTGTDHRDFNAIAFDRSGSDAGLAAGTRGAIAVSDDGGASWTRKDLDTNRALLGVALAGKRRIIVGQSGLVRYDAGDGEWKKADSGTDSRLMAVDLNANGVAIAVGAFGALVRSTDGGQTWQSPKGFDLASKVEGGYSPHIYGVQVADDGNAFAVAEFGLVLHSPDKGVTWNVVHRGDAQLFSLHIRDDGVGYAVGQQGTVLRTTDSGKTWKKLKVPTEGNLLAVYSDADGTVTAPGMRHMIVSDDDGETWDKVKAGDVNQRWYGAVFGTKAGTFAAGHTGRIIRLDKPRPVGGK